MTKRLLDEVDKSIVAWLSRDARTSNREIAADLGIRFNSVHGYVKKLHQHFDVSTRAELMARWIDR